MFLAKAGKYEPCRLFSIGHFSLIIITIICIIIALKKTAHKSKEEVFKIVRGLTIVIWILEICKICFNIQTFNIYNVKEWVPLYYCSLLLYAGLLSSFTKGKFKRAGDVFIATGSIIGGIIFIILPTTSLPTYPAFHFISFHSFFFHGTMIYLTILVNITDYVELEKKDILYFGILVGVVCIAALGLNIRYDSNLMFISKNFPQTPIEPLYNTTGLLFTPFMIVGQMTLPFCVVYLIIKSIKTREIKEDSKSKTTKLLDEK